MAIKVLSAELAADEAFRSRFVRESQLAAGLERWGSVLRLPRRRPRTVGAFRHGAVRLRRDRSHGEWNLLVFDDGVGDEGAVSGGWSLEISTAV